MTTTGLTDRCGVGERSWLSHIRSQVRGQDDECPDCTAQSAIPTQKGQISFTLCFRAPGVAAQFTLPTGTLERAISPTQQPPSCARRVASASHRRPPSA